MLVVTRAADESIVIGKDIVVFVANIKGDRVRLGVMAPGSVPIHRTHRGAGELQDLAAQGRLMETACDEVRRPIAPPGERKGVAR